MAIQYVGGQTAGRAGATSPTNVTFALSGGLASVPAFNDLVVITLVVGALARTPAMTISGYTGLGVLSPSGASYRANVNVLYKFMGTTPDTTVTMPSTGNVQDAQRWAIQVFRGVNRSSPIYSTPASSTNTDGTVVLSTAYTNTINGNTVVYCGGAGVVPGAAYTTNGAAGFMSGFTADTADAVVAASFTLKNQGSDVAATTFGGGPADMKLGAWASYVFTLNPARLRTFHIS